MDTKRNKHIESAHGSEYVPSAEEIAVGYEVRDTHLRAVLIFVVVFVATVVATWFVVYGVEIGLDHLSVLEARNMPQPHPMSVDPLATTVPPGPLLEPSLGNDKLPQQDLAEVNEQARLTLTSYKDGGNGFVRIPLESAIDMVVAKGLPMKLPATQPSLGAAMPPASSMHGPGGVP